MQKATGTAHDQDGRRRVGRPVIVSGAGSHGGTGNHGRGRQDGTVETVSRGRGRSDGPMDHGPRRSADEGGPESHIFRGED